MFNSLIKITLIRISLLTIILLLVRFPLTNAKFIDKQSIDDNEVKAGWWVKPDVEVKCPNGGEIYNIGDKIEIKWESESVDHDTSVKVKLFVSTDSGATYNKIADDLPEDGSYLWEITDKSEHMRIKAEAKDSHGLTNTDESDADFDPKEKKGDDKDESTSVIIVNTAPVSASEITVDPEIKSEEEQTTEDSTNTETVSDTAPEEPQQ
jgi:hypothetical protein